MDEGLAKVRHERSVKDFPNIRLDENEYVEFAFKRARASIMLIVGGLAAGLIVILLSFLLVILYQPDLDEMGVKFLMVILAALTGAIFIAMLIAIFIYNRNRLFITNKHVIQLITTSLTASSDNYIDLASIEDVSFHQNRITEKIFGYGTLRLATVGDETTYTFKDSDVTQTEITAISKLVTEAKKRSRPPRRNNQND